MKFKFLEKQSNQSKDSVPMTLMIKAMDVMSKADKGKKVEFGKDTWVIVEGGTKYIGDGNQHIVGKNLFVEMSAGARGEFTRHDGATWFVGVKKNGDFIADFKALNDKDFSSITEDLKIDRNSIEFKVMQWVENGRVGLSSKALCQKLTGMTVGEDKEKVYDDHPYDPSDFKRCVDFLEAVGLTSKDVKKMIGVSPEWSAMSKEWDNLTALYKEEKGLESAPKLYAEMQRIRMHAAGEKTVIRNNII